MVLGYGTLEKWFSYLHNQNLIEELTWISILYASTMVSRRQYEAPCCSSSMSANAFVIYHGVIFLNFVLQSLQCMHVFTFTCVLCMSIKLCFVLVIHDNDNDLGLAICCALKSCMRNMSVVQDGRHGIYRCCQIWLLYFIWEYHICGLFIWGVED